MEAGVIIFLVLFIVLYFLPTIVASHRKHLSVNSIFVRNLFVGWSVIFWVISVVWALKNEPKKSLQELKVSLNHDDIKESEKSDSIGDELVKIADLNAKGILSDDEFILAKEKILKK